MVIRRGCYDSVWPDVTSVALIELPLKAHAAFYGIFPVAVGPCPVCLILSSYFIQLINPLLRRTDTMIQAGFTIENPRTNSRTIVLKSDAETNGNGWLLEHRSIPHAPPEIPEHLHLTWTETFEIMAGDAFYKLDGVQKTASAGDTIVVHPHQLHIHPWNAGETELVYRQRDVFDPPSAQAVQEVLGVFATLAGLAQEGKVNTSGEPKNPLQLAATLKTLNKHGGYDAKLPKWLQDMIAATLGSFAEALGYRAIYPQFVNES